MECKSRALRKLLAQLSAPEESFNHFVSAEALPFEAELKSCASELSAHAAAGETLDFRRCRTTLVSYLKELLRRTFATPVDGKKRAQALLLLIDMSVSHPEAAYLVAESGLFVKAMCSNLECEDQPQQGLLLLTVCLAACVAHQVPESQSFQSFLTLLVDLACDYGSLKPFRPLQIHAVEALVHLCYSRASRQLLSQELCSPKVESLLRATRYRSQDGAPVRQHTFLVCLLLANLCDLPMAVDPGMSPASFGYVGFAALWTPEDFFVSLATALAAAARGEPWPPETELIWPCWKLVHTIERLSRHGYAEELRLCATPLMTVVARTRSQKAPEHSVRIVRLASEALRAIASASNDSEALRREARFTIHFVEALKEHSEEMPAAEDLLGFFLDHRDPLPYLMHADLLSA